MKKAYALFRSMKFGISLLLAVMAFSFAGSLIPQGRELDWYISSYPRMGHFIVALKLDSIFTSWYFGLLILMLCVNLTLCSLLRFGKVTKQRKQAFEPELHLPVHIGAAAADKLTNMLKAKRYRRRDADKSKIFYKNTMGFYGSFVVHLSILCTFVFGGLVLGLAEKNDYFIMPGESKILPDGTEVQVVSFRMENDTGALDYASILQITDPRGNQSGPREISVNHPVSYRSNKYYQHSYGVAGTVTALNTGTGGEDRFYLTERSFLSTEGKNGIWFETMYAGYVRDEHDHIIPVPGSGGTHLDPVYSLLVSDDGETSAEYILPGETVQVGEVTFTFGSAAYYPGIRVKHVPAVFPPLLYFSFALMIFGFWLTFFHEPVVVIVGREDYVLIGPKTSEIMYDIENIISEGDTPC